jgi:DNA-binding NarL/FixJ family response regulator
MPDNSMPDNNNDASSIVQPSLSDRELQVIELVTAGLTNEQIAEQLEISKRTVDNHISNILTKTDTHNRVALVRWALRWGKVCINEVNCCTLPSPDQRSGQPSGQLVEAHFSDG